MEGKATMSDVKAIIDQYAAENAALRQQMEYIGNLMISLVLKACDDKMEVRIPGKDQKKADKYALNIRQLKTSTVFKLEEKES